MRSADPAVFSLVSLRMAAKCPRVIARRVAEGDSRKQSPSDTARGGENQRVVSRRLLRRPDKSGLLAMTDGAGGGVVVPSLFREAWRGKLLPAV